MNNFIVFAPENDYNPSNMSNITIQTTFSSTIQILLMGSVGYLLKKRGLLSEEGLQTLTDLLIKILLPMLIFSKFILHFDLQSNQTWWLFPIISFMVTVSGYGFSRLVLLVIKDIKEPDHFQALVSFQNSGYIPLLMISKVFSGEQEHLLMISLFFFLLGFDLSLWSFGVWLIRGSRAKEQKIRFQPSPPFVAIIFSLIMVFSGLDKYIPGLILEPCQLFGQCALPIAMIVVGGNLAKTQFKKILKADVFSVIFAKLILMPLAALGIVLGLKFDYILGFLIVLECSMPSAVTLSILARHYGVETKYVNQGIFFSHLVSVFTIPVFLTLFNHFWPH